MKRFGLALVAIVALSCTGCGVLRTEATYPGGNVGKLADNYLFGAPNKTMQAYRGLAMGAALARVAERNVFTSGDAISAVTALGDVSATTARLWEMARSTCYTDNDVRPAGVTVGDPLPGGDNQCPDNAYPVLFEAKLPDLYRSIFLLGAAALPSDVFGDIASNTKDGNILGVLWDLLWGSGRIAESLEYSLAVGRSINEQRAITALDPSQRAKYSPFTVADAMTILSAMGAPNKSREPDATAFYAMFSLLKESCLRIRQRIDGVVRKGINCPGTYYMQAEEYNSGLWWPKDNGSR